MSNFAVSIPSYLHVSHGDEDIIKDSLMGGKSLNLTDQCLTLLKGKNMLLIKILKQLCLTMSFILFGKKIIMALNMTLN